MRLIPTSIACGYTNGDGGSAYLQVQVLSEGALVFLYKYLKRAEKSIAELTSTTYPSINGLNAEQGGLSNVYSLSIPQGTVLLLKGQTRGGIRKVKQGMLGIRVDGSAPLYDLSVRLPLVPRRATDSYKVTGRYQLLSFEEVEAYGASPGGRYRDWFEPEIRDELFSIEKLADAKLRERVVRKVATFTDEDGVETKTIEEVKLRRTGRRDNRR